MHTIKKIQLIFLLFCVIFLITGCNMINSSQEQEEPQGSYLVTQSDNEITKLIRYFQSTEVELEAKTNAATSEDAQAVYNEIEQLKTNLTKVDKELTAAITNNKITNEAKIGYDTEIETLKTDLDQLNSQLAQKLNS